MSEWINVLDKLPELQENCNLDLESEPVLIAIPTDGVQIGYLWKCNDPDPRFNGDMDWFVSQSYAEDVVVHVTHWMPLPELPND